MEWLRIVLVLLVSVVVGIAFGVLLSHLILRFVKKRETTFLSNLFSRLVMKRETDTQRKREAATQSDLLSPVLAVDEREPWPESPAVIEESLKESVEESDDGDGLYFGRVELHIIEPEDFSQVLRLQTLLRGVAGLRLVSVGGSADGNSMIVVDAEEQLPLPGILSQEPIVSSVVGGEKSIQLVMQSTRA